ncbi:MAG: dihydroorotase [Deltaproteobacteria bacterium]|nr:dihydroorotase [Deltaproteobacteria bacterium]
MRMLLKNGRLVDPSQGIDDIRDILIVDGKIAAIATRIDISESNNEALKVIDAQGLIIAPGFIDIHTHLREPGYEYKETIRTGTEAAVAGGFSAVACMANTQPVNDNAGITAFVKRQALTANLARVYPIAAITVGLKGAQLTDFSDLMRAGAVAFSDDGAPLTSSVMMRYALEYASSLGATIISHCEDLSLVGNGVANEGFTATDLGLVGMPTIAEDLMVAREIMLSEYLQARVHIAHVSSARAVRLIREAKERGVPVSAEATPHHFTLTEAALVGYDTNCKVNPPLRSSVDVMEVRRGLSDGTIDCIASDHAPHSANEKDVEFDYAAFGMVGLETVLPLALQLVGEGVLTLSQLVERMSCNPANLLGLPGGTLKVGVDADVTLFDTQRVWQVVKENLISKSKNTPFVGYQMRGKAVMTIVGGKIKFQEGTAISPF